jgi:hypothetical protein
MTHPFQRWPRARRRLALTCVAIAAVVPVVLSSATTPLNEDAPKGESIIDFELAGSVDRAEEILATWRAEGVVDEAKAIQIFDVIYPLIYAAALAGGCIAVAAMWERAGRRRLANAGVVLAWVAFAAVLFDYVENVGLAVSLWDEPASPWPQVALVAAVLKFTAIYASLLYVVAGFVGALLHRRGARPRPAS